MSDSQEILVQVAQWKSFTWLRHGFSTRHGGVSTVYRTAGGGPSPGGDLNLGWTREDDPSAVGENRRRLVAAVSGTVSPVPPLITVRQVHSASSLVVTDSAAISAFVGAEGVAIRQADGLITGAAGVLLGVQTADCVPVLVVDTRLRAVACFHAGWRGTAARIVEQGVRTMMAEFGSKQNDLIAAIGPSIGACCYSVGGEVFEAFTAGFSYGELLFRRATGEGTSLHLDLWEANRRQLVEAGLRPSEITVVGECTGCAGMPGRRRYFSHRCEQGFTGRMMSVIGIAEGCA